MLQGLIYCSSVFTNYRNKLSSDDSSKINEMLSHLLADLFMLWAFLAVDCNFFFVCNRLLGGNGNGHSLKEALKQVLT